MVPLTTTVFSMAWVNELPKVSVTEVGSAWLYQPIARTTMSLACALPSFPAGQEDLLSQYFSLAWVY